MITAHLAASPKQAVEAGPLTANFSFCGRGRAAACASAVPPPAAKQASSPRAFNRRRGGLGIESTSPAFTSVGRTRPGAVLQSAPAIRRCEPTRTKKNDGETLLRPRGPAAGVGPLGSIVVEGVVRPHLRPRCRPTTAGGPDVELAETQRPSTARADGRNPASVSESFGRGPAAPQPKSRAAAPLAPGAAAAAGNGDLVAHPLSESPPPPPPLPPSFASQWGSLDKPGRLGGGAPASAADKSRRPGCLLPAPTDSLSKPSESECFPASVHCL